MPDKKKYENVREKEPLVKGPFQVFIQLDDDGDVRNLEVYDADNNPVPFDVSYEEWDPAEDDDGDDEDE